MGDGGPEKQSSHHRGRYGSEQGEFYGRQTVRDAQVD